MAEDERIKVGAALGAAESTGAETRPTTDDYPSAPRLSHAESSILSAMSAGDHCLSFGTLRSRTGLSTAEIREALQGLRGKGLIVQLDTVVESYAARFPGLDVDHC